MTSHYVPSDFQNFNLLLFVLLNFPQWGQKIESTQKFDASIINKICMQTNIGGHGFSSFGDFAPFPNWQNFPFRS